MMGVFVGHVSLDGTSGVQDLVAEKHVQPMDIP
jgi:hypothetical protein